MAAEDEEGFENKKTRKEEVDFGAGEDEGNNAVADGAENGPGLNREINFGRRGGTDADTFLWVLNRRGLKVDEIVTIGNGQRKC